MIIDIHSLAKVWAGKSCGFYPALQKEEGKRIRKAKLLSSANIADGLLKLYKRG